MFHLWEEKKRFKICPNKGCDQNVKSGRITNDMKAAAKAI
jgi:hypothetical protein